MNKKVIFIILLVLLLTACGPESKIRVFVTSQTEIGMQARHSHRDHAIYHEGPMAERPGG